MNARRERVMTLIAMNMLGVRHVPELECQPERRHAVRHAPTGVNDIAGGRLPGSQSDPSRGSGAGRCLDRSWSSGNRCALAQRFASQLQARTQCCTQEAATCSQSIQFRAPKISAPTVAEHRTTQAGSARLIREGTDRGGGRRRDRRGRSLRERTSPDRATTTTSRRRMASSRGSRGRARAVERRTRGRSGVSTPPVGTSRPLRHHTVQMTADGKHTLALASPSANRRWTRSPSPRRPCR